MLARNSKGKCSSGPVIGCRPQTSMMSLDNGLADMQPDSHSIALGCIKGLEEFVRDFRCKAESRIFHAKAHPVRTLLFGSDEQLPRAIIHRAHRIGSIADQIKNHLLQLDTIARNERKTIGELRSQDHTIPLKIAQRQCNDFSGCLIQIQWLRRKFLFAIQGAQSRDHIPGTVAIANGPHRCFACTINIRRISIQPPKTNTRVGDEARERLVDLVGNRGGQCVQRRDPRHVGKL